MYRTRFEIENDIRHLKDDVASLKDLLRNKTGSSAIILINELDFQSRKLKGLEQELKELEYREKCK